MVYMTIFNTIMVNTPIHLLSDLLGFSILFHQYPRLVTLNVLVSEARDVQDMWNTVPQTSSRKVFVEAAQKDVDLSEQGSVFFSQIHFGYHTIEKLGQEGQRPAENGDLSSLIVQVGRMFDSRFTRVGIYKQTLKQRTSQRNRDMIDHCECARVPDTYKLERARYEEWYIFVS